MFKTPYPYVIAIIFKKNTGKLTFVKFANIQYLGVYCRSLNATVWAFVRFFMFHGPQCARFRRYGFFNHSIAILEFFAARGTGKCFGFICTVNRFIHKIRLKALFHVFVCFIRNKRHIFKFIFIHLYTLLPRRHYIKLFLCIFVRRFGICLIQHHFCT